MDEVLGEHNTDRAIEVPMVELQNARNVLRFSTIYALRVTDVEPYPAWLVIPSLDQLAHRFAVLESHLGM